MAEKMSKQEWRATLLSNLEKAYQRAIQKGWNSETVDESHAWVYDAVVSGHYDHRYPEIPSMDYALFSNLA